MHSLHLARIAEPSPRSKLRGVLRSHCGAAARVRTSHHSANSNHDTKGIPMKSISVAIALATIMLALFGATANVVADTIPLPKNDANYSYNWAGYVAVPFTSPVTSVQGNWTVPTINSSTTPNGWSAEWVGIDGLLSSTVEQIGILANGSSAYPSLPQYCAWVEMYPAP